jgi:hypothetical protein
MDTTTGPIFSRNDTAGAVRRNSFGQTASGLASATQLFAVTAPGPLRIDLPLIQNGPAASLPRSFYPEPGIAPDPADIPFPLTSARLATLDMLADAFSRRVPSPDDTSEPYQLPDDF